MNTCEVMAPGRDCETIPATQVKNCSLEEIVDGLERVVGDIEAFLQNFCSRLQTVTAQASIANYDSAGQQDQWDVKKSCVEQKLREQVDLLAEAWLRLEAEQRTLLQQQRGASLNQTGSAAKCELNAGGGPELHFAAGDSKPPAQGHYSIVHEFERLRQEIQSSRAHRNVKRD